jgi:hypothetical protein
MSRDAAVFKMRAARPSASRPLRSFVGVDLHLMAHVVDVPLQEVRDLLDRGAERETVPKLGNVNRGPGPCVLSAHGQRLSAFALRALPIRAGA